jgi:hypothetical protein
MRQTKKRDTQKRGSRGGYDRLQQQKQTPRRKDGNSRHIEEQTAGASGKGNYVVAEGVHQVAGVQVHDVDAGGDAEERNQDSAEEDRQQQAEQQQAEQQQVTALLLQFEREWPRGGNNEGDTNPRADGAGAASVTSATAASGANAAMCKPATARSPYQCFEAAVGDAVSALRAAADDLSKERKHKEGGAGKKRTGKKKIAAVIGSIDFDDDSGSHTAVVVLAKRMWSDLVFDRRVHYKLRAKQGKARRKREMLVWESRRAEAANVKAARQGRSKGGNGNRGGNGR